MLKGIDVSRHNRAMKDIRDINNYDFVIMKATEGLGYVDSSAPLYMRAMEGQDTLKGFYHFCRADLGNDPALEAENFIRRVTYLTHAEDLTDIKPLLALDVEGAALQEPFIDAWCEAWCRCVYNAFGYLPLIYTSESYCKLFKHTAKLGVGLWCAKWGNNKPKKIKPWEFYAIWQYRSDAILSGVRVDENRFNGNKSQFLKYCGVEDHEEIKNNNTESTTD